VRAYLNARCDRLAGAARAVAERGAKSASAEERGRKARSAVADKSSGTPRAGEPGTPKAEGVRRSRKQKNRERRRRARERTRAKKAAGAPALELRDDRDRVVFAIVIEAQRDQEPRKRYAWPVYVAVARADRECPTVALVIAIGARRSVIAIERMIGAEGRGCRPCDVRAAPGPTGVPAPIGRRGAVRGRRSVHSPGIRGARRHRREAHARSMSPHGLGGAGRPTRPKVYCPP
jgi:hypothetical protein